MATFFQSVRGTFGRQMNKPNGTGTPNQQKGPGSQGPGPQGSGSPGPGSQTTSAAIAYGPAMPPPMPAINTSASFSSGMGPETSSPQVDSQDANQDENTEKESPKFFFREKYVRLGVKGNFMPLAAVPENVHIAEWLAHHAMEQYRLAAALVQCVQEVDNNTGLALCNPKDCPVMSAGLSHTYTWLNTEKVPIKVPACQYISLVQRWVVGKLADPKAFPTENITGSASTYASGDLNTTNANTPIAAGPTTLNVPLSTLAGRDWFGKSAGFPETFLGDMKTCCRQMFRLYAHLYHSHWIDPFWHLSKTTDLNSCFVHFLTFTMLFRLLSEKDMEPMQPLIDIWVGNGAIPAEAAKGSMAINPPQ